MVTDKKIQALKDRLLQLGIKDSDLLEKFLLSGAKGGQHADKTSTAVYLKHLPTGIEVKCSETRERELNRFLAGRILADKLEEKLTGKSPRLDSFEKIRKQKTRRKRRNKNQISR